MTYILLRRRCFATSGSIGSRFGPSGTAIYVFTSITFLVHSSEGIFDLLDAMVLSRCLLGPSLATLLAAVKLGNGNAYSGQSPMQLSTSVGGHHGLVVDQTLVQVSQVFSTPRTLVEQAPTMIQLGQEITGKTSQENLGQVISLDETGHRMVVSAFLNDYLKVNAGAVYVYEWNSTASEWSPLGQDVYGGNVPDGWFGCSVSLSSDGSRWAAGARQTSTSQPEDSGSVQVFELGPSGQAWVQVGQTLYGSEEFEGFRNVGISGSGEYLGVGAHDHPEGMVNGFKLENDQWQQVGTTKYGPHIGSLFGGDIQGNYDGTRWVVSATRGKVGGSSEFVGFVRVYQWSSGDWVQMGEDAEICGLEFGRFTMFGYAVGISRSGNIVATTSPMGQVSRVYEWSGSAWFQLGEDIPSMGDLVLSDEGNRVAMQDGYQISVFDYDGTTNDWTVKGQTFVYGTAVSMSGDGLRASVGNSGAYIAGPGKVTSFDLLPLGPLPTPPPTPSPTPSPTPAPTAAPTSAPTPAPTAQPSPAPTSAPTAMPTPSPTPRPRQRRRRRLLQRLRHSRRQRPRQPRRQCRRHRLRLRQRRSLPQSLRHPQRQQPTPAPTPSPTVAATGDPHLTNVHGQRFDVLQPGIHTLLQVPRGPIDTERVLVRVDAEAVRMGGMCSDIFFQSLNISGSWVDQQMGGPLEFHVDGSAGGAGSATRSTSWMRVGPVLDLKVVWGHTRSGFKYLNLFARHLSRVTDYPIGGLLGADDHTRVSTPSASCEHKVSLASLSGPVQGDSASSGRSTS
ncbi:unnamed protein product [Prorocentrum cordatum]|uniref:Uncharacterized protein n=1 Tax=Prorocentrum cordatum TaxID=2364126 RepID=A0ABN9WFW6_9DINO|nr:unnamed protein product [Polarella glacialis]